MREKEAKLFDISQKITEEKARLMSPVVLAYLGDAVYSLYVREKLAFFSDAKSGALNKKAAQTVSAGEQAKLITAILPLLTEEEQSIYRRAKNAKKISKAKNQSPTDYSKSTGFEALIGYLYVTGQEARMNYLLGYTENKGENNDG
jgi:ribonuclease-3 family protein